MHSKSRNRRVSLFVHVAMETLHFGWTEDIIYPPVRIAPPANSDLPDTVKELYDEAAEHC